MVRTNLTQSIQQAPLARAVTVLTAQLARRTHAATTADVLPTSAKTVLQQAKISEPAARRITVTGAFTARWPQLAHLVTTGRVNTDVIAVLARITRTLPDHETAQVLDALLPSLPRLTPAQTMQAAQLAVDLLHPQDADDREQRDYDQRQLAMTRFKGMWEFSLTLPELEGATFWAAITAIADQLRQADPDTGSRPTPGQRRADALMRLVAKAAANGDLPTNKAQPPTAVITIGLSEAERVAAVGQRHRPQSLQEAAQAGGGSPAAHVQGSDTTLGDAAARFIMCTAQLTGVLTHPQAAVSTSPTAGAGPGSAGTDPPTPLATALGLAPLLPLAEGRAKRCFTDAQRRAMALRDQGCVITGCTASPGECEAHHVHAWANGGSTDISNAASLCWVHHREIDLGRRKITRSPDPAGPYWITEDGPRHRWPHTTRQRR